MFNATLMIQATIRGKLQRWKYIAFQRKKLEERCSRIAQRIYRGHKARKRVRAIRKSQDRQGASTKIQATVRRKLAYGRVKRKRVEKRKNEMAVRIQSLIRGFLARKNVHKIAEANHKYRAATKIQQYVRGMIARVLVERRKREILEFKNTVERAAVAIQKVYRGFRGRVFFKIKFIEVNRKKRVQAAAATKINTMIRGFVCRAKLRKMKKEQYEKFLADSRMWKETWSEDAQTWFYLNLETKEAIWEPPVGGYTKNDDLLVLGNGQTIEDPAKFGFLDAEENRKGKICSECSDRVSIRKCHECGDKFCTPCYKETHSTGTRRAHTWEPTGPLDCVDCEVLLAERWCVSCDEAFCDGCWKRVHAKGKRRHHPFSEVDPDGKVDTRIFTIDGEQLQGGYDTAYSQRKLDAENANSLLATAFQYNPQSQDTHTGGANAGSYAEADPGEWTEYADDGGTQYWYNNYTGVSQYENPWGY